MAKKGVKKKSGGKAKKTKEKVNPREAFMEARLGKFYLLINLKKCLKSFELVN